MLTETYLKEHFVDAYFIDNERQNIEILTISHLVGEAIKRISNSTSVSDLFR